MRHEARLNRVGKDGAPARAHLEASKNPATRALLNGPACPEELEYLLAYAYALYGRSGVGLDGAAPLSYSTVADWSRLRGVALEWWEIETVMAIDAVFRHPSEGEPREDAEPAPIPVWPTRKAE